MTTTVGGLSTSVIAVIAVGGVGLLLILIVVIGFCCDLPARFRRRKAAKEGHLHPQMNDIDVEKDEPSVFVKVVDDQSSQSSKSIQHNRAPSPVCTCEHPNIVTHQSTVQLPQTYPRPGPR